MSAIPQKIKKAVYTPTDYQLELHQHPARFRIVCAGTRVGKTFACIQEVVKFCIEHPNMRVWWVAPISETTERGFETFQEIFPRGSFVYEKYVRKTKLAPPKGIFFKNGSRLDFKSADSPKALIGVGLDFLVIDEAAFLDDAVWFHYLRPRLTDKGGRAIIISTPERKNWFYELYQKGLDPAQKEYVSFHWETSQNIFIKDIEKEIAQFKEDVSEEDFRNLFLAEFLSDAGQVFKNLDECTRGWEEVQSATNRWWTEDSHDKKHTYTMGVDVAKGGKDFTVIIITKYHKSTNKWKKRVVYLERINEDSFVIQAQRIYDVWRQFDSPHIYIDATSIGATLVDELQRAPQQIPRVVITPIVFSGKNKGEIIGRLRADLEHNRISFPKIPVLIAELSSYERKYNPETGKIKYSAPGRQHDDCVVSLALATMREQQTTQRVFGGDMRKRLGF